MKSTIVKSLKKRLTSDSLILLNLLQNTIYGTQQVLRAFLYFATKKKNFLSLLSLYCLKKKKNFYDKNFN